MELDVKQLQFILLICLCTALQAKTYFVKPLASGSGSSWQDACPLLTALASAEAGDDVWVAAGAYLPTTTNNRDASFQLRQGVRLYGGFSGQETSLQQRNWMLNKSILSGDIGQADLSEDNAYTILYIENGENILVDGFIFTSGMARDFTEAIQPSSSGGAIFINSGSPQISNCQFINNQARYGGAVYINGQQSPANPVFSSCRFEKNQVSFNGGAIYNNGKNGMANPIFQACTFEENKSDYGACIFNDGSNGECAPLLINCKLYSNHSLSTGALVYSLISGDKGKARPILENCDITGNTSILGEDVASNRNTAFLEQANAPTGGSRAPVRE